jgi:hypothetical protein
MKSNSYQKYFKYISKFLLDKNLSHFNIEDKEVFRDLLYHSKFGAVQLGYMKFLIKNLVIRNFKWTINVFSIYINYLGKLSNYHQMDIYDSLFRDCRNIKLLESLFKNLKAEDKLFFLETINEYNDIIRLSPQFKLYITFS